jgi:dUTP pyrophosphatase
VVRLSQNATLPTKGSEKSAGFDLYSAYSTKINNHDGGLVLTDIAIKMPDGVYARIAPRSGLTALYGINVGAGVVDPDYRGNIMVFLFNHGNNDFYINQGDRIAQIIFEKYLDNAELVECKKLEKSKRGGKGFGSTGLKKTDKTLDSIISSTPNEAPLDLSMFGLNNF